MILRAMTAEVQPERGTASSHYDLLARLAAGGMAEIFLARANSTEGLERYVVLKRIRPERGDDPRWVRMFLDEARLAAQLQHPNIAQVFDLGRIGEDLFYTMEYVHGRDVLDIVAANAERRTAIPINVVLAIITGAAAGLAHAHERAAPDGRLLGIVHRDVSPANLMVSYEGTVKVVDFGVAKARHRTTETEAGTIMGKLAYLSPEQCKAREVDHRSDVFSLGIVFHELVTGTRAFKRGTDFDTMRAVIHDELAPPSAVVPDLPPGLDDIITRALEKDPDDRFQTVTEMIDAIEEVAQDCGISLTAGVLRRYMRDLFGTRPEPWRVFEIEELVDESSVIEGFPIDAEADEVPLLQATGLIDISALFAKSDIQTPPPRRIPTVPPPPPRLPSGSQPVVPAPSFVPAAISAEMIVPAAHVPDERPPTLAELLHTGPRTQIVRVPSRRRGIRRDIILIASVAAACGIALGVYLSLSDHPVAAPASVVAPELPVAPVDTTPVHPAALPPPERTVPVVAEPPPPPPPMPAAVVKPVPAPPRTDVKPPPPATRPSQGSACTDPLDCQY